jgi:hypothetical protein
MDNIIWQCRASSGTVRLDFGFVVRKAAWHVCVVLLVLLVVVLFAKRCCATYLLQLFVGCLLLDGVVYALLVVCLGQVSTNLVWVCHMHSVLLQ